MWTYLVILILMVYLGNYLYFTYYVVSTYLYCYIYATIVILYSMINYNVTSITY
jgi:hypothetical protein